MRDNLMPVIAQLAPCKIAIEACTGAVYWQRRFEEHGHTVKIISPQYVKPFVRRQKNDGSDAEAICTAGCQARMRFVLWKTIEQQDIQAFHPAHQRLVNHRTALVSKIWGMLLDRGIAIGVSITRARRTIPEILRGQYPELTDLASETIGELYDLFQDRDQRIRSFDRKIERVF